MTEKTQWQETIEELKREPLSENVRDYLRRFFTGRPATPTPAPTPAPAPGTPVVPNPVLSKEYIKRLDQILKKHQTELMKYADEKLNITYLKRRIKELDFCNIYKNTKRKKNLVTGPIVVPPVNPTFSSPPNVKGTPFVSTTPASPGPIVPAPKIPTPSTPASPAGTKKKKKPDLPRNSIFETLSREWTPRITGLNKVMKAAREDVLAFLSEIATKSGYTPKNPNDIKSLISQMRHFTILDKRSLNILRSKLIGFIITYKQLEYYSEFFKQNQDELSAQEKLQAKKYTP